MLRVVVMVVLVACGRVGFDAAPATMDAADAALVVSIADDRMAGPATISAIAELPPGTTGLSLREALVIAGNHPGPDRIRFDTAALPPGSVIAIQSALVVGDTGTAIEAADAGITLAGKPGYTGDLLQVTGDAAVIDGLQLQGGGTAVDAANVSGLVLNRLAIQDTSGDAIHAAGCSQLTIESSRVDRAGGTPVLIRTTSDAFVLHNMVSLVDKTARIAAVDLQAVSRGHVVDNIIDPGNAFLVNLTDSSDGEVIGNILDRGDSGITLVGNSQRNLVFRNVVISAASDSVFIDTPAMDNRVINNTFYMSSDVVNAGSGTVAMNNLVTSTANEFIDPARYDFHLVAGHPAIDAADDTLMLDMLPDQPARFLGNGPDRGAVESY